MNLRSIILGVAASLGIPGMAAAQWIPASELIGQPLQVTTNGVVNTVYLDAGGSARIVTSGGRAIPASWAASQGQLCLNNGAASECWPYAAPFQANHPVTLASSCNSTSTWLAQAVNAPPPPPAQRGERGR
jgi:hypothetical protein